MVLREEFQIWKGFYERWVILSYVCLLMEVIQREKFNDVGERGYKILG